MGNNDYSIISLDGVKKIIDEVAGKVKNENHWLEFKKSPNDVKINQIAAFLNAYGGVVIIGIDENNEKPLVGVSSSFSSKFLYDKIDAELQKYSNNLECKHYVDIEIFSHRGFPFWIMRVKPLKTKFVVIDGRIYFDRDTNGKSNYLDTYIEVTDFIAKKRQHQSDVKEYIELLDLIDNQCRIISLWNATLSTPKQLTKKENTIQAYDTRLSINGLVSSGTLPRAINLSEYTRLRKNLMPLFLLDESQHIREATLQKWLQDTHSIVGNDTITYANLEPFIKSLHAFKTSRAAEFSSMLMSVPTIIKELKEYFASYS